MNMLLDNAKQPSFTGKTFGERLDVGFKEFPITIQANDIYTLKKTANYVKVYNLSVARSISFQIDNGDLNDAINGFEYQTNQGEFFRELNFYNNTGSPVTFSVIIGSGNIRDPSSQSNVTGNVGVLSGSVLSSVADVSCPSLTTTQILVQNTNRKTAIFTNPITSGATLRYGDSLVGATRGIPIAAGVTVYLDTTAAIFIYNPSGGAISMPVLSVNT